MHTRRRPTAQRHNVFFHFVLALGLLAIVAFLLLTGGCSALTDSGSSLRDAARDLFCRPGSEEPGEFDGLEPPVLGEPSDTPDVLPLVPIPQREPLPRTADGWHSR